MSHANNKFVKAVNQGGEPTAERFSNLLKGFFMRERECDDAGYSKRKVARKAKPGNEGPADRIAQPVGQ